MIDANRDGFIDKDDLKEIHMNLGRQPSDDELKKMLSEAPGQLNFTAFLTLFGEKMHGTYSTSTHSYQKYFKCCLHHISITN